MFSKHDQIRGYDDELLAAMDAEEARQEDHLELIASENYTSKRVMQAQGSGLTNKYAEGYPGKRYYGGCEHVDKVEQLAIDRARQLFGADYPRAIRASATTAAANTSTRSSGWPSTAPGSCSAPTMPTSSRIPVPRPTPRCTWRCSTPATPSSA
ncbi:hypothetical protein B2G63_07610 [Pseudomonas aeruginosa]|nr:hypothetical protein B2G63_07610 [Pseudomonas aeruginosa]